jgi:hypothetical protein
VRALRRWRGKRSPPRPRLVCVACVLCGSADSPTDEDVIPRWLLRLFDVQGAVTVNVREEAGTPRPVATRPNPKIMLRGGLCSQCNNERLSRLENAVKPILGPMARNMHPTVLGLDSQRLLAAWAVKTVYLLELAARQQYPGSRLIEGYEPGIAEMGWLLDQLERRPVTQVEPQPRSMVWLACWDANERSVFNYAPSSAPLPSQSGKDVVGQFSTLAVGYAAFQVFTVDYVVADQHGAVVWNTQPPPSVRESVPRIWPHLLGARAVSWPPPAFRNSEFDRLANWDGTLRSGVA